jgi:hypothetical protein
MKFRALVSIFILISLILFNPPAQAADEYISDPSNIPFFDDFNAPEYIKPGDSGILRFTVENRYEEVMTNITLTVGVYACTTSYSYIDIADVKYPPTINGEKIENIIDIQNIESDNLTYINITIKSFQDTTQGTFFIRFQLNFNYNNTVYIMRSRGYFTEEEWETAISQADEDDPGKVDIDILGIDGIIPDTSFKIQDPIPQWPLYVCFIPFIVMLGILAILFYAQEEYNVFPWLDQGFKYWSGKLHQSWRLFKHRFRKT